MSKVEIGSKYNGPAWDRPCLRQLPRHWQLEEAKKPPTDWGKAGTVLLWLAGTLAVLQMIKALI